MLKYIDEVNKIVRNKWRTVGTGWKVTLVIGIILLSILALVGLIIWGIFKLIGSLAVPGTRNMGFYFPAGRRKY